MNTHYEPDDPGDERPSVEELAAEIQDRRRDVDPDRDALDALTSEIQDTVGIERFDQRLARKSLPGLLVGLVALRDRETNGQTLLEDFERAFQFSLSAGTVYPCLHDLEDEGILEMRELIQTKEYEIQDPAAARERVEAAACQHAAYALFLEHLLDELDPEP